MNLRQEAFFLPVAGGQRLCIWREPATGPICGRIVHIPAFAEEMNKCRPMTALVARRVAECGFGVLEIDLLGCGDSSGDFGGASWEDWIDDVVAAIEWSSQRGGAPLWLWGTRAGALLASAVTHRIAQVTSLLLWQPVLSGRTHLTQFLRLKLAAEIFADGATGGGTKALRAQLQQGAGMEIAGYRLSPELASGMDAAEFAVADTIAEVVWLEVTTATPPGVSPASQSIVDGLCARGKHVQAQAVQGPGFWQSVETEMAPALVEATVAAMASEGVHVHA
ncbi:MAG: hydrolase 2, exosortase A system-associated [Betaproteobacteria bacterium]